MADETTSNEESLPPKVNLQNTDALKVGNGNGAPVAAKPITLKAKPISKSGTAKIPLDMASSGMTVVDSAPHTKTIKIKPVISPGTRRIDVDIAKPAVAKPVMKAAPLAAVSQDVNSAKSQTSKIPLDIILNADSAVPPSSGGPKTIRLKRPGATSKPSVVAAPASATVAKIAKETKTDLRKTSRLDIENAGVAASETTTGRKTIRVKRPSTSSTPGLNVARSEPPASGGALPTAGAPMPPVPIAVDEEKYIISGIASIAALFVICTLVYVLLAQVVGQDNSLTKLSYFMPKVNLSWPGEISSN